MRASAHPRGRETAGDNSSAAGDLPVPLSGSAAWEDLVSKSVRRGKHGASPPNTRRGRNPARRTWFARGGHCFRQPSLKLLAFLPPPQTYPCSAPSLRRQRPLKRVALGSPVQPHHNAFPEPLGSPLVRKWTWRWASQPREQKNRVKQ
jgi:hypothetical protein